MISTLRLRCLSEAQPDTRFYRILHKKQFDEAETFAKQFNLDVEVCLAVKKKLFAYKITYMIIELSFNKHFSIHITC